MRTRMLALAGVALIATGAAPIAAQTTSPISKVPSLVTVDLRNVLNDLSVKLNLDRANVPVTAQVPVTVAANVCGVSVNVLAASTGGQAACSAKTGSVELAQAVQQQMAAGGSVAGSQSGGASGVGSGTTVASLGGSTGGTSTGGTTSTGMNSTTTAPAASNMPTQVASGTAAPAPTGTAPAQPTATPAAPAGTQVAANRQPGTAPAASAPAATTGAGTAQPAAAPSQNATAAAPGQNTAAATEPGRSAQAPGHVKKRHHSRSARDYAPGQQR